MNKLFIRDYVLIIVILGVGSFFRLYHAQDWFIYGHDGDLYSWVVKDILVNGHLRLIGQLTSTPGIFIGSGFYYLISPFYYFGNMSPFSLVYFAVLLAVVVMISYFWVFYKLYGKVMGFVMCSLQAVLLSRVMYDRWVVPTVLSSLWEVWFFYCLVQLVRGHYYVLAILGLLFGGIWQINFSLLPAFLAVGAALVLARKYPPKKWLFWGGISAIIANLPLIIFEAKHGFGQTRAFIFALTSHQGGASGWDKVTEVFSKVSGNIYQIFLYPYRGDFPNNLCLIGLLFILVLWLIRQKKLEIKVLIVLLAWLCGVMGFFMVNSKVLSEYYLENINIIFIVIMGFGISEVIHRGRLWRYLVISGFIVVIGMSVWVLSNVYQYNRLGYPERLALAKFIKNDSIAKGYPCVAISYVTSPGNNFGFRYVFNEVGLKTKPVSSGVPVYTIAIPETMIPKNDFTQRFGAIRVNIPDNDFKLSELPVRCTGDNSNLTDSLFGYTE